MKKKVGSSKKLKGFSLVELIIVIAIMAVLIAVLTPQYLRYIEKSRQGKDVDAAGVVYRVITAALADTSIDDRPIGSFTITKLSDFDDGSHDKFVEEICRSLGASDLATFETGVFVSNAYMNSPIQVTGSSDGRSISLTVVSNIAGVEDIAINQ